MIKSCNSCIFYSALDTTCRYDPPRIYPIPGTDPMGRSGVGKLTMFPEVNESWWCGKFLKNDEFGGSNA